MSQENDSGPLPLHLQKKKFFSRTLFIRWGFSFFFFFLVVASSCLVYNVAGNLKAQYLTEDWTSYGGPRPFSPKNSTSDWNILLDSHSHTRYSDGYLTPEQNLLWHITMGYNAMVLTDHNSFQGSEEIRQIARSLYNDTIKVLIGTEWTTRRVHLNLILPPNVTNYDHLTPPGWSVSDDEIQTIIQETHNLGGLIIANHIPWSETHCENTPTREELLSWGVDYIEIVNENIYDEISYEFCQIHDLGMITGTDMHFPDSIFGWTILNTTEFTEEAIFQQLVNRQTQIIFNATGVLDPVDYTTHPTPLGTFLAPFIDLGDILTPLFWPDPQWGLIALWMFWFHILFFTIEGLVFTIQKIKKKRSLLQKIKT